MASGGHPYRTCRDGDCPLPWCRVWKEARAEWYMPRYWEGFADGEASGYAAGFAAGQAAGCSH